HARALEPGLEPQPQRVDGGRSGGVEHRLREPDARRVALTAELEPVELDEQVHAPGLSGRQLEPAEVEYVRFPRHTVEISAGTGTLKRSRPRAPRRPARPRSPRAEPR